MEDDLNKIVKRICTVGALHISTFVRDLKLDILRVKLPSTFSNLKLIESSPEVKLRKKELEKLVDEKQEREIKCTTKELRQDFLEDQKAKARSLSLDEELADAYGKDVNNRSDGPLQEAKINGVVLRRSPKYVSMVSLDGSKEFLVEIGDPFPLLEVKIKDGDVLSVIVNPDLRKTKDLNPELICCCDMSDDEVGTFLKCLKLKLMNNPFEILGEFGRSFAVWKYILDESGLANNFRRGEDKKQWEEMSKSILEICKIFSDLQMQTQMTTTIRNFWNALKDSKFFNEVLPTIIKKDETWQKDNVHLVQTFLENLLKVYPECAVRAIGILECLTCIPESGINLISQKLFSIIAPFVAGVSEKPKHLKWNQKSVIPLPTELQDDPKDDYKDLQPVRVKKEEDEVEEGKKCEKKGSESQNEVQHAYESEEEYIKTYYTLLREECFYKGKKGIHSFFVKGKCDPKENMLYRVKLIELSDLNQLSIHEGLSLVLEYHNNNETSETEDVNPDNSKWLMLGNLVCLLLDVSIKNPVWGIISKERRAEDSKKKHVHVSLCTKNNILKDSEVIAQLQELKSQGFPAYMIESQTFYPAYGPPLEVLKQKVTVPFAEQLVKVKRSPMASQQQSQHCSVARSDSFIQQIFAKLADWIPYWHQEEEKFHDQPSQHPGPNYLGYITKPPKWDVIFENPSPSECNISSTSFYDVVKEFQKMREDPESKPKLDDKQLDAVEQALFNKVALIQGPPGTGKSFVGKALLHLLLSMEVPKRGPILIVTYKNHSLDEFLESFLEKNPEFKEDVVRVGKSKEGTSELLQQCNLSQLASGKMENKMHQNCKKLGTELHWIKMEIDRCFSELEDSYLFTAAVFLKEADNKHLKSLIENVKDLEKLNKMMKNNNFLANNRKELLEMIKNPLKTWLPKEEEFNRFASNAGITQAKPSNTECLSKNSNYNQSDSGSGSEKTNEDDCVGLETQPSDDLEERQGALPDQHDITQLGEQIAQPAVPTSPRDEEVLVTVPVIPDEKLGNFKSILNAGDIKELSREEKILFVYALLGRNRKSIKSRFSELTEELSQKQQIKKEIRDQHNVNFLKERKVIFMTVSGAAIRASWLESIKPSVMIVEEAAEILESQLVAVIPSSVQHLIMIGDHQQLRPQVHYEVLSRKCNFHISMFERLIKGGLDYTQLNQQGRMSDDLAQLVRELGIYDEYKTREEVVEGNRLPKCLTKPMFFFDHKHEVKTQTSTHSKYNIKEADKIIKVARFLLKNSVPPEKITILCSYRGQVNHFNSIIKKKQPGSVDDGPLTAIKVITIDSFQGKENDIILLSLVSNYGESQKKSEAKIGYLSSKNRLCVAISRARCGLYLFGNADLLSDKSKRYWKKIIDLMRSKKCLGKELSFLNQEGKEFQCIRKKSIGDAPNTTTLITDLKILLESEKPLQDDFALLAEQFGLNRDKINHLKSTGKPTEELFNQFSRCTIGELQDKINNIKGLDYRVADTVKNYIDQQNCKCVKC